MRQSRNGQAALEFLATYGWAIMVVLVMIGALAYFGVLNPTNYLPEKCLFTTGITCKDHIAQVGSGGVRFLFIIENGLGSGITINTDPVATYNGATASCANATPPYTISAGESRTFTCAFGSSGNPGTGQRVKARIDLNYTEVGGAFVHPITGEIQATTQSGFDGAAEI